MITLEPVLSSHCHQNKPFWYVAPFFVFGQEHDKWIGTELRSVSLPLPKRDKVNIAALRWWLPLLDPVCHDEKWGAPYNLTGLTWKQTEKWNKLSTKSLQLLKPADSQSSCYNLLPSSETDVASRDASEERAFPPVSSECSLATRWLFPIYQLCFH